MSDGPRSAYIDAEKNTLGPYLVPVNKREGAISWEPLRWQCGCNREGPGNVFDDCFTVLTAGCITFGWAESTSRYIGRIWGGGLVCIVWCPSNGGARFGPVLQSIGYVTPPYRAELEGRWKSSSVDAEAASCRQFRVGGIKYTQLRKANATRKHWNWMQRT